MDLSKLRLADGISISIHLGDIPLDAWVTPGGEIESSDISDPVLILVEYYGKVIMRYVMRRDMWTDEEPDLVQKAIDNAVAKSNRPPLVVDPNHPLGPRLVE